MGKPVKATLEDPMVVGAELSFPINMNDDSIKEYANAAARKMADAICKEIRKYTEPNWWIDNQGWRDGRHLKHHPGIYRVRCVFKVEKTKLEF